MADKAVLPSADKSALSFPCVKVLGSRVHLMGMREVIAAIEAWIRNPSRMPRHVIVTGFHGIWLAREDARFKQILNSADLWIPDGIAPVWVARLKGFKNAVRTPGMDLVKAFLERADKERFSSFFYGDTDETLALMRQAIEIRYPGHRVAGVFSPPFRALTPEEDEQIVQTINASKPDVLWVGLGLPKQERWIWEHRDRLHVPVAIGVGAAFGFLGGKVQRCPHWLGRLGLEWLWRLLKEPRKLWRRNFLDGPRFVWHVLLELMGIEKYD
ncbi:MAG: WecB/TagA/CpsF family glycosyltransferase [Candidatus Sumerlaeota bacterium]|nr:WecB/TagA/CpsF family glycosyltransferase [Candidatus Sumerlaeota bacterium]